jgi:hypothetical protein
MTHFHLVRARPLPLLADCEVAEHHPRSPTERFWTQRSDIPGSPTTSSGASHRRVGAPRGGSGLDNALTLHACISTSRRAASSRMSAAFSAIAITPACCPGLSTSPTGAIGIGWCAPVLLSSRHPLTTSSTQGHIAVAECHRPTRICRVHIPARRCRRKHKAHFRNVAVAEPP